MEQRHSPEQHLGLAVSGASPLCHALLALPSPALACSPAGLPQIAQVHAFPALLKSHRPPAPWELLAGMKHR